MSTLLRWLVRRDIPEVLDIERASFTEAWSEGDFAFALRERNWIGIVAERDGRIQGFMFYELHKTRLHLLNLAVHPDYRRQGVGYAMIDRLKDKLSQQRRVALDAHVREGNLAAAMFFKAMGFVCRGVEKDYYEGESAYWFRYRLGVAPVFCGTNRVSQYFGADA